MVKRPKPPKQTSMADPWQKLQTLGEIAEQQARLANDAVVPVAKPAAKKAALPCHEEARPSA